jgi:hypothetical protein
VAMGRRRNMTRYEVREGELLCALSDSERLGITNEVPLVQIGHILHALATASFYWSLRCRGTFQIHRDAVHDYIVANWCDL